MDVNWLTMDWITSLHRIIRRKEVNDIFQKKRIAAAFITRGSFEIPVPCPFELGKMYASEGWVQQFHLGVTLNANTRMLRELGPDTGFDSIGDYPQAQSLAYFPEPARQ